jgi:FHA domain
MQPPPPVFWAPAPKAAATSTQPAAAPAPAEPVQQPAADAADAQAVNFGDGAPKRESSAEAAHLGTATTPAQGAPPAPTGSAAAASVSDSASGGSTAQQVTAVEDGSRVLTAGNAAAEQKKTAMAAAMAAVKYAAPGNRERVLNEAMAADLDPASVSTDVVGSKSSAPTAKPRCGTQHERYLSLPAAAAHLPAPPACGQTQNNMSRSAAPRTPPQRPCRVATPVAELGEVTMREGAYEPPDWGEAYPAEDDVSLDVMKTGTILESVPLAPGASFATFGRNKGVDVLVEHPSASRLQAVLQFRGREAFLADCGSTHGTYLNQAALESGKFYAVHVGSQFRFGQSTRSYILSAPEVRCRRASLSLWRGSAYIFVLLWISFWLCAVAVI